MAHEKRLRAAFLACVQHFANKAAAISTMRALRVIEVLLDSEMDAAPGPILVFALLSTAQAGRGRRPLDGSSLLRVAKCLELVSRARLQLMGSRVRS